MRIASGRGGTQQARLGGEGGGGVKGGRGFYTPLLSLSPFLYAHPLSYLPSYMEGRRPENDKGAPARAERDTKDPAECRKDRPLGRRNRKAGATYRQSFLL